MTRRLGIADGSGVPSPSVDITPADQRPRALASARTATPTEPAKGGNGSDTAQRRSRTAMANGITTRKNLQKRTICPDVEATWMAGVGRMIVGRNANGPRRIHAVGTRPSTGSRLRRVASRTRTVWPRRSSPGTPPRCSSGRTSGRPRSAQPSARPVARSWPAAGSRPRLSSPPSRRTPKQRRKEPDMPLAARRRRRTAAAVERKVVPMSTPQEDEGNSTSAENHHGMHHAEIIVFTRDADGPGASGVIYNNLGLTDGVSGEQFDAQFRALDPDQLKRDFGGDVILQRRPAGAPSGLPDRQRLHQAKRLPSRRPAQHRGPAGNTRGAPQVAAGVGVPDADAAGGACRTRRPTPFLQPRGKTMTPSAKLPRPAS